ncbi:programmed cell death protein 2-like [Argiope bruennichi]|uniref:Programmed cell death protein 2 like protein n=1 Tax=Argiope bruennichi TaxID=94029 RepID=A0A8T0EKI4_ARGBR|nr:programmed cell death protein 2-like [Argiope bruennichi]KAF8771858.1 Programmed cell death protein 2 like protein [Argiope bruennichi]
MAASKSVVLAFVEECDPEEELRSCIFPSKVGGCPAWLRLKNLPNRSDILCKTCDKPLIFLLQIYCNIDEVESAFHRTFFLFICANGKCYKRFDNQSFVVFRNQLPRLNEFYSYDAPDYKSKKSPSDPSADKYQPLCSICGCVASLKCQESQEFNYCSENHRDYDKERNFQNGGAKNSKKTKSKREKAKKQFVLPEYELIFETEVLPSTQTEKSDAEKMKEYRQFMQSTKAPNEMQEMPLDDLDSVMKRNDKAFNKFRKRISLEPEQVLRYERGGTPLWVSAEHVPSPKDIPNCICGAKRTFEFQVMPQLLNYLSLDSVQDSVDWGTLAVYTCSKSCDEGVKGYVKEFVWKQDFSDNYQQ